MNSKMKSLMLPYMMLASGALNPEVNEFNSINSPRINVKPEWERKKCKSCSKFPQFSSYCSSKGTYVKKLSCACENTKRENNERI